MVYQSICGDLEKLNSKTPIPCHNLETEILTKDTNNMIGGTVKSEDYFSKLLELAADNNVEDLKQSLHSPSDINKTGLWYGRVGNSTNMSFKPRTPLMVAATYGSVDVVKLILSLSEADVNFTGSPDKITALHCAASGASVNAVDVVKLLLINGADINSIDCNGRRPCAVISAPPGRPDLKIALRKLLLDISSPPNIDFLSSILDSTSISLMPDEKKEYPIDPSIDIDNAIFASDEFRMFSFKVRPCLCVFSHDWTACPFVHNGENARRRDPRKYHYTCIPCPDFRKGGSCKRGDMCEYAHGIFESWLHPSQYRTRLCKEGSLCGRRVCFFAHNTEELRYPVTPMEMAMALSHFPGPQMSPTGNGMAWSRKNISTLHLPNSNLQTSRPRLSFNARDFAQRELLDDVSGLSSPCYSSARINHFNGSKTITPSNFDSIFSNDVSPRYTDQFQHQGNILSPKNLDHTFPMGSFGSLPSMVLPRGIMTTPRGINPVSPKSYHHVNPEKWFLSPQDIGFDLPGDLLHTTNAGDIGPPVNSWPDKWESSNGQVDWSVQEDLVRFSKAPGEKSPSNFNSN